MLNNFDNKKEVLKWRMDIFRKILLIFGVISFVPSTINFITKNITLLNYMLLLSLTLLFLFFYFTIKNNKNVNLYSNIFFYISSTIIVIIAYLNGGLASGYIGWLLIAVMITGFLYECLHNILFSAAYVIILIITLSFLIINQTTQTQTQTEAICMQTISLLLQIIFITIFSYFFKLEKNKYINLLNQQQITLSNTSKLRAVSEMSKGLAHEINNPLTQIRGYIDILKEEINTNKFDINTIKEYIDEISLGASKISVIICKTQEFTKNINFENKISTRTSLLIEQALILLKAKIGRHKPIIECFNNDVELSCVPSLTIHALTNIISNAIDFMNKKKESFSKIKIYTEKENQEIRITVENNGPMIPENIIHRIFEPFFTTKAMGKGIGLGLSMTYNIMQQQEGCITCTSDETSTKFILSFPA